MSTNGFRVIVVGGGPVGLTAAHALTQAGISFTILESRPSVVIDAGSNLVLLPMGMRLLGQLGLMTALNAVSSPLGKVQRYNHQGRHMGDSRVFIHMKENHGLAPRVISRHDLTKVQYDALPDKSKANIFANKKVINISTTPNGVVVECADGTSYEGSVVIGADGAHSRVRRIMRALAVQAQLPEADINDELPFLTTYRAMWIRFPTQADLHPGDATETHGKDCTIQTFAGEGTSVIGMYERLPEPTLEPPRYTSADEEAFVKRWGHLHLSDEITVQHAYDTRVQAGLVNLEEGVVKHWGWDRIVLIGDAAHKFTPSTGAGCNNGMADVAVLINELHKVVLAAGTGEISTEQIDAAIDGYQQARHEAVEAGKEQAGLATATATWKSPAFRIVDKFVMPCHRVQKFFMAKAAPRIASAPVLDFVPVGDVPKGKVPWAPAPVVSVVEISS